MTYTDTGKLSPETQSAIEQEIRTLLKVRTLGALQRERQDIMINIDFCGPPICEILGIKME